MKQVDSLSNNRHFLIIYASRYGSTKRCANIISQHISDTSTVISANQVTHNDIRQCTDIVIGTAIYATKALPSMKKVYSLHEQILLQKPLSLFVCGLTEHPAAQQKELSNALSGPLRAHVSHTLFAGGSISLSTLTPKERAILTMIGQAKNKDTIDTAALKQFAHAISQ